LGYELWHSYSKKKFKKNNHVVPCVILTIKQSGPRVSEVSFRILAQDLISFDRVDHDHRHLLKPSQIPALLWLTSGTEPTEEVWLSSQCWLSSSNPNLSHFLLFSFAFSPSRIASDG
jgi:hypothetical protein